MGSSSKKQSCKLCGEKFQTIRQLKSHGNKFHFEDDVTDESITFEVDDTEGEVKEDCYCYLCDFDYMIPSEIKRHNNLRHWSKSVVNDVKVTKPIAKPKQRQSIRNISKRYLESFPKLAYCDQCCMEFGSESDYKEHSSLHLMWMSWKISILLIPFWNVNKKLQTNRQQ